MLKLHLLELKLQMREHKLQMRACMITKKLGLLELKLQTLAYVFRFKLQILAYIVFFFLHLSNPINYEQRATSQVTQFTFDHSEPFYQQLGNLGPDGTKDHGKDL